jgi:hypothetical protein
LLDYVAKAALARDFFSQQSVFSKNFNELVHAKPDILSLGAQNEETVRECRDKRSEHDLVAPVVHEIRSSRGLN